MGGNSFQDEDLESSMQWLQWQQFYKLFSALWKKIQRHVLCELQKLLKGTQIESVKTSTLLLQLQHSGVGNESSGVNSRLSTRPALSGEVRGQFTAFFYLLDQAVLVFGFWLPRLFIPTQASCIYHNAFITMHSLGSDPQLPDFWIQGIL